MTNVDDNTEDFFDTFFKSWKLCKNHHIYIENISNQTIKIPCLMHHTLFIENCHNLIIDTCTKFNHVVVLNCENINANIPHGLISGIDIIRSKNIFVKVSNSSIYNLTCISSDTVTITFDDVCQDKMLITTTGSYKTTFNICDKSGKIIKNFTTNMSYFPILTIYQLESFNNSTVLNYVNEHGGFGKIE